MYCSKCISIGTNNTMTAGCDYFKTSSLTMNPGRFSPESELIRPT